MAGRHYFSHSRLSAYETCPRKYRYRYLDKLDLRREGIEAFTGTVVHDALEWLHTEVRDGRLPALEALTGRFQATWAERWTDEIAIVRSGDTPDTYRAMGARCLSGYYRRYHPFDQGEVVGIEQKLEAPLDPYQQHWIMGYADRITRLGHGRYEIRDYKTGRWVPAQDALDRDRQLALYQFALPRLFPDAAEVVLVWNYLQKDVECRSQRTPGQLEALRRETLALVLELVDRGQKAAARPEQADALFPTQESRLCDWCDYRELCPAKGAPPEAFAAAVRAARERVTGQLELF